MRACIDGIAVLGPGLAGWRAAAAVLAGAAPYVAVDMPKPATDLLPPAERRRCGEAARLALALGTEALAHAGLAANDVATVFTSSSGNGEVVHQICEALAAPEREVSPTRFHNSVHNAPAGYWSIGTGSHAPSTSLAVHPGSFAAGLLEAALQAHAEARPVLLIAYELPHPFPLSAVAPIVAPFGIAMVVQAARSGVSLAETTLALGTDAAPTTLSGALEALRVGNSAAHALPLLAAIARGESTALSLPYLADTHLGVSVHP